MAQGDGEGRGVAPQLASHSGRPLCMYVSVDVSEQDSSFLLWQVTPAHLRPLMSSRIAEVIITENRRWAEQGTLEQRGLGGKGTACGDLGPPS